MNVAPILVPSEAGSDAADVSELLRQLRGLLLEFRRVVTSLEALGVIDINYDSGCSSMAIPTADLVLFMPPHNMANLAQVQTLTATDHSWAFRQYFQTRVLCHDGVKELIG